MVGAGEPAGRGEFAVGEAYVAAFVFRREAYHHLAGEWPALAAYILYIFHFYRGFFFHFAGYALLKRLSGLYKPCHKGVNVGMLEVGGVDEERFIASVSGDEHHHGGGKLWPYFASTVLAFKGYLSGWGHMASTEATEAVGTVEVGKFLGAGSLLPFLIAEALP